MNALAYALLIIGYTVFYYGMANIHNGGKGPSLSSSFGFSSPIAAPGDIPGTAMGSSNQTGQPASANASPGQIVRNV